MIETIFEFTQTQGAQLMRSTGYAVIVIMLWHMTMEQFAGREKFRWAGFLIAGHMSFVVTWATLITVGAPMSGAMFNLCLSISTFFMILSPITLINRSSLRSSLRSWFRK